MDCFALLAMTRLRGLLLRFAPRNDGGALPKVLRRQLDRLAVRRAVGGPVPGVAVAVQEFGRRDALGGDEALQRRQPMLIVGLAGVGIAGGLRALDLGAERL